MLCCESFSYNSVGWPIPDTEVHSAKHGQLVGMKSVLLPMPIYHHLNMISELVVHTYMFQQTTGSYQYQGLKPCLVKDHVKKWATLSSFFFMWRREAETEMKDETEKRWI